MIASEKRRIADIKIGDRHRKDFGDLEPLAESIKNHGLLQAVGITENDDLVFGERRLRACRDVLNWVEIDVRVVNVADLVAGEHDENEIRKDFTPSERVAILGSIRRKRLGDNQHSGSENFPTRERAAGMAGFGNIRTAQAAQAVVAKGTPELVEAMDAGKVSIDAAARLARLPAEEQREVIAKPPAEIRKVAAATRSAPRKVTGPGSGSSRQKTAKFTVPKTVRQAATAIMNGFGSLGLVEDLIEELQKRVRDARATPGIAA